MFAETSVPAGLLRDHSTKDGVWGLIHVERGQLRYRITDPRREATEILLAAGAMPGIVEPTIVHHVEPVGAVLFQVEFFRTAAGIIPLCRFEELAERENRLLAQKITYTKIQ
ncbi:DUF1971 domain-containing protein [Sphingomonas solaris]|uniref:DUF1971 domain-containing protein n=1 Tax=Alterirhizorhabdus solaris TaxID=2529389 RepID=A0A558QRE3_9SPHN|nr:DUF1971 domain-containing protein [Sphingomonas solaris]TVV69627.1 DUF1971 domain-containing protein [Sphingomonas solaris]